MTLLQRIELSIMPRRVRRAVVAESCDWLLRCKCGHERSVWDAGGIRFKAYGNPRRMVLSLRCASGQAALGAVRRFGGHVFEICVCDGSERVGPGSIQFVGSDCCFRGHHAAHN